MADWQPILDGGLLLYEPALYAPDEADRLFAFLRDHVAWQQHVIRGQPAPRLNAWFSDPGLIYQYSGLKHVGTGWTAELDAVRARVENFSGTRYNSLLLNRYRDGQDSISFHTDAEPELGTNPVVATLSLGATRRFVLKHRKEKRATLTYELPSGSCLVMGGTSQHHWLHGLPKTTSDTGERISLTFRCLRTET